jgi:hypothetical protein
LAGLVISEDGRQSIRVIGEGMDALHLGNELAEKAMAQGANDILALTGVK